MQRVVAVAAVEATIVPIPAVHRVVAVPACAKEPTGGSSVAQVRARDTERERERETKRAARTRRGGQQGAP